MNQDQIRVSFDMTPSIGLRTGIGQVVSHMYDAISEKKDIKLEPYALSYKAKA